MQSISIGIFTVCIIVFAILLPITGWETVTGSTTVDVETEVPNREMETVTVQPTTQDQWGAVPGAFDSTFTTEVSIFAYGERSSSSSINEHHLEALQADLQGQKTYTYNLTTTREMTNIVFAEDNESMTYVDSYTYSGLPDETETIQTLNYPMASLFYQMNNKPYFLGAFQVLAQVSDKFYSQNFASFFYSKGCYQSYFWDQTEVEQAILAPAGITEEADQAIIYTDPKFGMNSIKTLSIWTAGYMEEQGYFWQTWPIQPQMLLRLHFAGLGITLEPTFFASVFSTSGIMGLQIQTLNSKLSSQGYFPDQASITPENIGMLQWAQGNLLSDPALALTGGEYSPMNSAIELGMEFVTAPEQPLSGCNAGFDYTQALALFDKTDIDTNEMSLLNAVNVKFLLDGVTTGNVSTEDLMQRFGLENKVQLECLVIYIQQQENVGQPSQAMGSAIARSIDLSLEVTIRHTAFQLASRTMGAYDIEQTPELDCSFYVAPVITDATQLAEFCSQYNFRNLTDLQFFVGGTWYENQADEFKATTGWTDDQISTFYDTSVDTSFGGVLKQMNADNYAAFNCHPDPRVPTMSQNCTGEELGYRQWGASEITLNNKTDCINMLQPSWSISAWGDWYLDDVPVAPEYYWYSQFTYDDTPPLNGAQTSNVTSQSYTWYGLQNSFNAKMLVQDIQTYMSTQEESQFLMDASAQFGLTVDQLYNFVEVMSMQVGEYLFGGQLGKFPAKNLIHGWQSELVDTVAPYDEMTEADYFRGDAIFYDPFVTPILNNVEGSMAHQKIQVSTGNGQDTYPNQVMGMNGYSYPNKMMGVYTMGSEITPVSYRCPGKSGDFDTTKKTFNGVQNMVDNTDGTSYVLDTKGLHWIDLDVTPGKEEASICTEGTDEACSTSPNAYTQLVKGNESSDWAEEDSCGFNIHLGGNNMASLTYDSGSGFATQFLQTTDHQMRLPSFNTFTPYRHMVGLGFEELSMSNVVENFAVSPDAFTESVYVENGTRTVITPTEMPYSEKDAKTGLVITFAILLGVFVALDAFCIYKACTRDKESYPEFDEEGHNSEQQTTVTGGAGDREGLIQNQTNESTDKNII